MVVTAVQKLCQREVKWYSGSAIIHGALLTWTLSNKHKINIFLFRNKQRYIPALRQLHGPEEYRSISCLKLCQKIDEYTPVYQMQHMQIHPWKNTNADSRLLWCVDAIDACKKQNLWTQQAKINYQKLKLNRLSTSSKAHLSGLYSRSIIIPSAGSSG